MRSSRILAPSRVAREALANASKHSPAGQVVVSLARDGDAVTLEVGDDGCGFALPAAMGRGMGLRSMQERIEALGGELTVDSQPGAGTWVVARCPIGAGSQRTQ